jgi:tetratricopeptide (TPR) repeat protein
MAISLRTLVGTLLIAALLGGGSAWASGAPHDVERYLAAAARLYENLEYEDALEKLGRARKLSRGAADDVLIALYEGLVLADLGQRERAQAAFKTGLLLDPAAKLPVRVSPKVERDFEDVRAEVRRELAPILARREAEQRAREHAERQAQERAGQQARQQTEPGPQAAGPGGDRPERPRTLEVIPDPVTPLQRQVPSEVVAVAPERKAPVLPFVFAGLGAAAVGGGAYFGLQSQALIESGRQAQFQDEAQGHLKQARDSARLANILFATAGTAAVATLVSFLTSAEPGR